MIRWVLRPSSIGTTKRSRGRVGNLVVAAGSHLTRREASQYAAQGHFGECTMQSKVEAVLGFLRAGPQEAVLGFLRAAPRADCSDHFSLHRSQQHSRALAGPACRTPRAMERLEARR